MSTPSVIVYLAGPMTGLPAFNYPAFKHAAAEWRRQGWEVLDPTENYGGDTTKPYREYIRADLALLMRAEAIALLEGWQRSRGARFELHVAQLMGLEVYNATTFERIEPPMVITKVLEPPLDATILQEAQRLVHGDRGADYGHPIDDYTRTGRLWGAILGIPDIDPRLCTLMMAAVKVSREVNKHKRDNLVDLAGYAECGQMVAERQGLK
jgi:hypothetical protein